MLIERLSKQSLVFITAFIIVLSFQSCLFAKDLTKDYQIVSPKLFKKIVFVKEEPAFSIKAPADWYMAMAKWDVLSDDRAFFFEVDPTKALSKGKILTPHIKISFLKKKRKMTADKMVDKEISKVEKAGSKVFVRDEITVSGKHAVHYVSEITDSSLVMDTYFFTSGKKFICVKTICESKDFERMKPMIKYSIDSIKF